MPEAVAGFKGFFPDILDAVGEIDIGEAAAIHERAVADIANVAVKGEGWQSGVGKRLLADGDDTGGQGDAMNRWLVKTRTTNGLTG